MARSRKFLGVLKERRKGTFHERNISEYRKMKKEKRGAVHGPFFFFFFFFFNV